MSCACAPALVVLRDQLDARWPSRSRASDGCCASSAHHQQNPTSDHEPDRSGYAHAFDVTNDPAHGVNGDVLVSLLMTDARVKYIIWQRRIWFPRAKPGGRPAGWSAYTGANPHTKHVHVSIIPGATHVTSGWPLNAPAPSPPEEDEMADPEVKKLLTLIADRLGNIENTVARWGRKNGYDESPPPIKERSETLKVLDRIAEKP